MVSPTVTAGSPDEGPTSGGQTVTLTGTGFRAGMQVSFGGAAATGLTIVAATQATVVTAGARGRDRGRRRSRPRAAPSTLTNGYTYVVAPTVTAVSPDEGPTSGGSR